MPQYLLWSGFRIDIIISSKFYLSHRATLIQYRRWLHEDINIKREVSFRAVFEVGCPNMRVCIEGLMGAQTLYALDWRTVLLYWGWLSFSSMQLWHGCSWNCEGGRGHLPSLPDQLSQPWKSNRCHSKTTLTHILAPQIYKTKALIPLKWFSHSCLWDI